MDHRSGIDILEQVQLAKDHAAHAASEALIMSYSLRKAIDLRWQLINEIKRMSNGMHGLANRTRTGIKMPQPEAGAEFVNKLMP